MSLGLSLLRFKIRVVRIRVMIRISFPLRIIQCNDLLATMLV